MAIYVDLDGTLAHHDNWQGMWHIGRPIALMLQRVRKWLAEGQTVKIFTARLARMYQPDFKPNSKEWAEITHFLDEWAEWCASYGLPVLECTAIKGFDMEELWDDRAIRVNKNEGTTNEPRVYKYGIDRNFLGEPDTGRAVFYEKEKEKV